MATLLFFMVVFGVLYEVLGPKYALKMLFYEGELDKNLVEPEEEITLYHRVVNQSWLPTLYMNLMTSLPGDDSCKYRMYLLGRQMWKAKTKFSCKKRGYYQFGNYYIEAGDAFGIRSEVHSDNLEHEVVVMPKKDNSVAVWKAYSGFIGDISVQRFILEDPVLTVGFREYTGHEPMKSISFLQTAKMGKTYVKCYDYTTELKVTILLNMYGGTSEAVEHCFEIVRTVCEDLETRHIAYGFASNGDVIERMASGLGSNHFNTLMREMGKSKLISFYSLESLLRRCEKERYQSRGYILVTPPLDMKNQELISQFNQKLDFPMCILMGGEKE